jgi:metal-responsive CopG/Arc/MetJ family transcriptional regulator
MAGKRIEIELPDELFGELSRIARIAGITGANEAAMMAIAEWVFRRRAELDNLDPKERYFVNEALDELAARGNPDTTKK